MSNLPPLIRYLSGVEHTRETVRHRAYNYRTSTTGEAHIGDYEIRLDLAADRPTQKKVLADLRSEMARRCAPALSIASRNIPAPLFASEFGAFRHSDLELTLLIPGQIDLVRSNLAPFIAETLINVGTRPKLLGMLDFELWPDLHDIQSKRDSLWEICSPARADAHLVALAERWRSRLPAYLGLDLSAGAVRYPGLIEELHVGLAPLEHALCRYLVENGSTGSKQPTIFYATRYNFGKVPDSEMVDACRRLSEAGWIEDFDHDFTQKLFFARRGPKLRKLSRHDLLEMIVP